MTISPALTYLLLIRPHRLDKAEATYEENGCSSVKGYSKSFLFFVCHTLKILTIIVPGFRTAYNSHVSYLR